MTFDEIYATYCKMVFNLALHYVQNVEDAEEITQDVFVKIFNGLHTFKNQSSIKTWIYRITINQSLDFISSRNTKKRLFLTSFLGISLEKTRSEAINFNHPGVELEQKEAIKKIFEAINQLSDTQKTAIILLKIEGKSQNETAEIMKIHIKALESLVQRAKKNLKKYISCPNCL